MTLDRRAPALPVRRGAALLLTVALTVCLTHLARADPIAPGVAVDAEVTYYTVRGTTWSEIYAAIRDPDAQLANTGMAFEGVTFSGLSLDYGDGVRGRCSPSAAKVRVRVVIRVPRLDREVRLSKADEGQLAKYDRSLTDHEEGHMRIAIESGEALLAAVRSAQGGGCDALEAMRQRAERDMQEQQEAYDARTEHGLRQGRLYE